MTKSHVHAENMRLYAEDAAKTDKPWTLWQHDSTQLEWVDLKRHPSWMIKTNYRRKPVMVTVGRHSWPEPLKEAPLNGTVVYCVGNNFIPTYQQYSNNDSFLSYLKAGLIHETADAAKMHYDALHAINRGDI